MKTKNHPGSYVVDAPVFFKNPGVLKEQQREYAFALLGFTDAGIYSRVLTEGLKIGDRAIKAFPYVAHNLRGAPADRGLSLPEGYRTSRNKDRPGWTSI